MVTVPQEYFDFVMDFAPYFYYIPGTGVDPEWERGPTSAAHAIDFLAQAHQSPQYEEKQTQINQVKTALKGVTGIYRKRIAGTKQPFPNKQQYQNIIDKADNNKIAKMLRILGFLTQTKVYLFWEKMLQKSKKLTS